MESWRNKVDLSSSDLSSSSSSLSPSNSGPVRPSSYRYKPKKTKSRSYSIFLFRYSIRKSQWEIVLVKRNCSYEYIEFFRLKSFTMEKVVPLLAKMTLVERASLINSNWRDLCLKSNRKYCIEDNINFDQMKEENWFLENCLTLPGTLIWEIPKGKPIKGENGVDSAIREFREETSIDFNYNLIGIKIEHTIYDNNIAYPITYYVAKTNDEEEIKKESIDKFEIAEAKWVSVNDVCEYPGAKNILDVLSITIQKMRLLEYF